MNVSSRRAALATGLCALALAGCGSDDEPKGPATTTAASAQRLTADERARVRDSERAIVSYCRRAKIGATGTGRAPTVAQQARALEAVDELVALAAAKPDAEVAKGVETSLFVGDLTENLQGSNCDAAIVARLEAGLATVP